MISNLVNEKIPSEIRFRAMTHEISLTNHDRTRRGMSRRLFLRATLAGGASLLAGRAATLFAAGSASNNSGFTIGGDLPVNRLGFGAMRLTGEGIWGWPPDRENARSAPDTIGRCRPAQGYCHYDPPNLPRIPRLSKLS